METAFSLQKLLFDIKSHKEKLPHWKDFEELVGKSCKIQDPSCRRNYESSPDVTLSNGFGIEAKIISKIDRDINLNSASPDPKIYYIIAFCPDGELKDIAAISGANFFSPEIKIIEQTNTSLRDLQNKYLRYRTRIMWQIKSPFIIWGRGNFVVDALGKVKTC
jgi:hypothetical protein